MWGVLSLYVSICALFVVTYVQNKKQQSETVINLSALTLSKPAVGQGSGFEVNEDEEHGGFTF